MEDRRFWAKVSKGSGCWEWTASRFRNGHGKYEGKGKVLMAHRRAWELAYGPLPPKNNVVQTCKNKLCVRLEHLKLETLFETDKKVKKKILEALVHPQKVKRAL